MLNKILIFWWIGLSAILIVENIVTWWWCTTHLFLSRWSPWTLSLLSIVLWLGIWYWIKWTISDKNKYDDDRMDF